MTYIVLRAQISIAMKEIVHPTKPLSVDGCTYEFYNATVATNVKDPIEIEKSIHHVSFLYYTLIGVCSTAFSGLLYTFILGRQNPSDLDPLLVAPFLRNTFFPKGLTTTTTVVHSFEKVDTKL